MFKRWIPGARLIGPILLIGTLNIMEIEFSAPPFFKVVFAIILGVFFGLKIGRKFIEDSKNYLLPIVFMVFWYIGLTMVNGNVLSMFGSEDKATSFLSVIPGGLTEVSIMAMDYEANLVMVTAFQLMRLMTIVMIVPYLVKKYAKPREIALESKLGSGSEGNKSDWIKMINVLIVGCIGGLVFSYMKLPAAFLTGSLIFTSLFSCFGSKYITRPPEVLNNFAQLGMGALIGVTFTRESFMGVVHSFGTIALITGITVFSSFILAYFFSKKFKWNYLTSFLSVVPGGLAPIMIMADEIEIDASVIALLQIIRLITAVMVIPFIYLAIL